MPQFKINAFIKEYKSILTSLDAEIVKERQSLKAEVERCNNNNIDNMDSLDYIWHGRTLTGLLGKRKLCSQFIVDLQCI